MAMRSPLLALALLLGCADDAESIQEQIQGSWLAEVGSCVEGWTFTGNEVERKYVCTLLSGSIAMEIHAGTFELRGSRLSWTWRQSSCPQYAVDDSTTFTLDDVGLRMTGPGGTLLLKPPPKSLDEGLGVAAKFGCIHDDGTFEPGTVTRL